MIDWALVFAADMAAGLTLEPEKRREKNEMMGNRFEYSGLFGLCELEGDLGNLEGICRNRRRSE